MKKLSFLFLFLVSCSQSHFHHGTCANTVSKIYLSLPIKIKIDGSVPSQYYACINAAANVWNAGMGHQMFSVSGGPDLDVFWNTSWGSPSNEEAYTQSWYIDDATTYSEIHMDAQNFTFSTDIPSGGQVDCESVMIHEMGHALGLSHITTEPSVMAPVLGTGEIRRTLYQVDIDDVNCLYSGYDY